MKRLAFAALVLIASVAAAMAQNATVIGPITPGDCTMFASTTIIKDGGFPCPGAGGTLNLPNGTTATTQTNGDSSTKVATDAFVQNNITNSAFIVPTTPVTATTLQAAITAACATSNNAIVQIPVGNWTIDTTSASINIASPCQGIIIQGSGGITSGSPNGTLLTNSAAANDLFNVTTNGAVVLRDFGITASVTKNAGTALIRLNNTTTGNSQQVIERLSINGGCNSIEIDNSFDFIVRDNLVTSFTCAVAGTAEGIVVTQPNTSDQGNNLIEGNKIWDISGTAGADSCILWNRGSGLRIIGNRCLGAFNYGLHIKFDKTSGNDGALIAVGNTFEVQNKSGIYLERTSAAQSAGTTIGQMVFSNNFIQSITSGGTGSINVTTSGGSPWVQGLTVTGNTIQNTIAPANGGLIEIDAVDTGLIADNTIFTSGAGNGSIRVTGVSVNVTVANNVNPYTPSAKYGVNSTTTVIDATGMTVANLPSSIANGSLLYTTDGNPNNPTNPIQGSSTGALAMRVNGAWMAALTQSTWNVFTHVGYTAVIAQNSTFYMNGFGHEATESNAEQALAAATTFSKMRCQNSSVGGSGQTSTYTLMKNGSATSLAVTINSGSTTGTDLVDTVSFAAGDTYSVRLVSSATTGNLTGGTCSFSAAT